MHGGKRPGAGRKPSVKNKMLEYAMQIASEGISPLDYMLEVLRNPKNSQAMRLDAAKAAAPYVHPRLAQIEHRPGDGGAGTQIVFLGGVLASPAPMIEMQKMDETVN